MHSMWDHTEVVSLSWDQTPALCLKKGSSPPPSCLSSFIYSLTTVSKPLPLFDLLDSSCPPQVPLNKTAKGKHQDKWVYNWTVNWTAFFTHRRQTEWCSFWKVLPHLWINLALKRLSIFSLNMCILSRSSSTYMFGKALKFISNMNYI